MYAASEIDGAYYSYVRNIAVRLTHLKSVAYFPRYWQGQLTLSDWFSDGTYIYYSGQRLQRYFDGSFPYR
ncbi:MAG: hypothetical protein ACR5LD_01515 [Symbiopectobacterium sp.]